MTAFKRITKDDFPTIDRYFDLHLKYRDESRFCDYAPGTVKMWHEAYSMEYATEGDVMFLRAKYEEERGISYLMPVGRVLRESLLHLYDYIQTQESATLSVIPEKMTSDISEIFGVSREEIFADRDWADYIYLRRDFCEPSGKKHHNYKYNLNKFAKEHPDYKVETLTRDNCKEAVEFFKDYCKRNPESSSEEAEEYSVTLPVIEDPLEFSMSGALLRCDGKVVGLTLGEVYGDTVIVHTEKAEKSIAGAYQTLARGYQLMMPDEVIYINREEDMGLEGLRRSKLSYAPERLEYKYTLYYK